jgi:hypothetical protein
MTPNWPSLWAREPGLKPVGDWSCGTEDFTRESYSKDKSDAIAAALCRDAAVRWLAIGGDLVVNSGADGHAVIERYKGTEGICVGKPFVLLGAGDTIDQALYAACSAVLDAKGKA